MFVYILVCVPQLVDSVCVCVFVCHRSVLFELLSELVFGL